MSELLVFADDWGRHPSSCQYLVRHLLDRHHVTWVNTIGTRTPRLDAATLWRGLEKGRQWLRGGARPLTRYGSPQNLRIVNPRMWPWFGSAASRWLNRHLLVRQLAPLLRDLPQAAIAVTTIPLVADLIGDLPVRHWVYYCVDDFGAWPGLDSKTLQAMDARLIDKADVLIAVSETLLARLAQQGRNAHLLTHGVDLDFWLPRDDALPCTELQGLQRPLVLFWGVIDRRMDGEFLQRLTTGLANGTIVLAGPTADPDPALLRLPRVQPIGPLPVDRLPYLAREAAVLIMPYADLPVTRAMQPLKLKEYLATGKPVVVRDLPANRAWADCLDLAATPEAFAQGVQLRLETGLPSEQRRARQRLTAESWAKKARSFAEWIGAEK